jgi:hypothetical protein
MGTFRMPRRPLPRLHRAITRLGIAEAWVCEIVLTACSSDADVEERPFAPEVIREAIRRRHHEARAAAYVNSVILIPERRSRRRKASYRSLRPRFDPDPFLRGQRASRVRATR